MLSLLTSELADEVGRQASPNEEYECAREAKFKIQNKNADRQILQLKNFEKVFKLFTCKLSIYQNNVAAIWATNKPNIFQTKSWERQSKALP